MANPEHAATPASEHEHHDAHIHLPPNSWSPINVALSLSMCFIGTLSATWVWVVGLVWLLMRRLRFGVFLAARGIHTPSLEEGAGIPYAVAIAAGCGLLLPYLPFLAG